MTYSIQVSNYNIKKKHPTKSHYTTTWLKITFAISYILNVYINTLLAKTGKLCQFYKRGVYNNLWPYP